MKSLTFFSLLIIITFGILYSCTEEDKNPKREQEEIRLLEEYINHARNKENDIQFRIDNAEKATLLLRNSKDDIEKREKLTKISRAYLSIGDSIRFLKTSNEIIDLASRIKDSAGIGSAYVRLGIFYDKRKILDSTFINYYKAEKIYAKLGDKKAFQHGKSLLGMAIVQREVKDYIGSSSLLVRAIKRFKSDEEVSYNYLSICFSYLGMAANNLGEHDKAIEYHKESIKNAKNLKTKDLKEILAYNNIGIVLKNQKKFKEAIEYYNRALGYKDFLKKDKTRYALLLDNLTYMRFLSGERDGVEELFKKSLKIRDSIGDKQGISTNTLHLAEYYRAFDRDSLAKFYAERSKNVSKSIKYNSNLLDSYKMLSNLSDKNEGLKYAQEYIKLNDSLNNLERQNRDKFARIRFETDQKEQQIAEVQNRNTIYLLGILLLLSFIGFVFMFYRQRTKYLAQQNKIVQFQASYDTETRISKRLHDELGNDIFQVMLQYQHNPQDASIPEKLNIAYNKARDISRENSEFDTGTSYLEELTQMLQNYTQNEVQLILRGLDKIDWEPIDKTIKMTVYRVLQELMTNMQKHSQAGLVALVFANTEEQLSIRYSDNGVGMDLTDQKVTNGLRNTEKRIQAINGTLIFTSEKDKGFKAEIQIPT